VTRGRRPCSATCTYSLPATGDSVVSPKMKARGKELRAKEMSALSLGGKNATKLQATKTYTVTFGKDSGCGSIHLDNPTFDVHFYLVPTAEAADFVFPTTLPTYGDDYFVGTGGFFADSELEGHAVMGVNQPSEYEILPEGDYTVKLQFSPVGCPCSMPNCEIFMQNPLDTGDHDKLLTDDPSTFLCPNLADECGGTFPSLDQLVTLEVSE